MVPPSKSLSTNPAAPRQARIALHTTAHQHKVTIQPQIQIKKPSKNKIILLTQTGANTAFDFQIKCGANRRRFAKLSAKELIFSCGD